MTTALVTVSRNTLAAYPTRDEWQDMREIAKTLVAGKLIPRAIDTPEKALTIMLKGRELGWPPLRSFAYIHIIEGKTTLAAEGMRALVLEKMPGARFRFAETTDEKCVIEAARPGDEPTRFTYTIDDARRAGLLGKDNWRKHPRNMMQARCTSEAARAVFPDIIMGCSYVPEELGAPVDENGDVIDVAHTPVREKPTAAAPAAEPTSPPAPSEPSASPPPAPAKREPAVYKREGTQEKDLQAILEKRDVPPEIWAEIDAELYGKPFTALKTIVPAARARFEAHLAAAHPANAAAAEGAL